MHRTLRQVFGLDDFRPGQLEVIRNVMAGRDTLAVMPTGAGKSLCYQLPAVLLPGMTLVVSPLIALMKDQVQKLDGLGLDASQLNSTLSAQDTRDTMNAIAAERAEFVLTTPERAATPEFLETLAGTRIDLLVIDEAHCLSEWGHDFRPAYLSLGAVRAALGGPPVLALTATATDEVRADIARQLGLEDLRVVNTGLYRDNLAYEVQPSEDEETRMRQLLRVLEETPGTGIVYASTVKQVVQVTAQLDDAGLSVAAYHGRLPSAARRETQDRFMRGDLRALVATNAFGLGIDKPDIRFVVHVTMPGSLEAYYQESGRAGRDGQAARAALLYQPGDRRTHLFFMAGRYPSGAHVQAAYRAVEQVARAAPAPVSAIAAAAPNVPVTKLRVALARLQERGWIDAPRTGLFRLAPAVRPAEADEDVLAVACDYDARQQADRDRLDRITAYAQTARCRWRVILEHFGEPAAFDACGGCDNCRRDAARQAAG